jgi:phage terminase small subunit
MVEGLTLDILRKRTTVQKLKRTRDREILVNGPIPFRDEYLSRSSIELKARDFLDLIAKAYWKRVARFI